mgnify:FL=1
MFSVKQREFLDNANRRWNIKYGATRSGKTHLDYYVIPKRIRSVANKQGLIAILGNTKGTLQRNIIEPLQSIWGSELVSDIKADNTALLFGEKCYCLGADTTKHINRIRGPSFKYCYGDEVATWNEGVFQMLKSRLDKPYSKFDGTCNPEGPSHWFKKFLDSDADIFQQKYTLYDNPFLAKEVLQSLETEYRGTVFFDRYILGDWKAAEGTIYMLFADETEKFLVDKVNEQLAIVTIGVDYGAGKSKIKFVASGITYNFRNVYVLDEMDLAGVYDPEQIYEKFIEFYKRVYDKYDKCQYAFCDYGALGNVITLGLIRRCQKERLPVQIVDCSKGLINDRIFLSSTLMAQKRFFILRKNTVIIKAFQDALWNSKSQDERLDDGTTDIDSLDAFEYSINSFYENLINSRR